MFCKLFETQFHWLKPVYDSFRHFGCLKLVYHETVYTVVYTASCLKLLALCYNVVYTTEHRYVYLGYALLFLHISTTAFFFS